MSSSGPADLNEDVRECRGTAEVGEGGRRQHVNRRALAIGSLPVAGRRHHHTRHDVGRNGREGLERATVVEHANGRARDDATLCRIVRIEEHCLFLARLRGLCRQVAVVRIQEGVALRRDQAERIARREQGRRARVLVRRDVVGQVIDWRGVLIAIVALAEQRHHEVAAAGDGRAELALP